MTSAECLFCRIAGGAVPAEVVAQTEQFLAFKDIKPHAPVHLLIIPVEHIPSLADVTPQHTGLMGEAIQFTNRVARQFQLAQTGYRVVVNCGEQAGQTVSHLHLHLLGGRPLRWPPG